MADLDEDAPPPPTDPSLARLRKTVRFYQSRFPTTTPLSSSELVAMQRGDPDRPLVLVDARTEAERRVSYIEGAVTPKEFQRDVLPGLSRPATVVTYCTIGYRSGMECRRLQDKHRHEDVDFYNLDGIVAYAHALEEYKKAKVQGPRPPRKIVTKNNITNKEEESKDVHTFGFIWDFTPDEFTGKHFALPRLLVSMLRVGGLSVIRTTQHLWHRLTSSSSVAAPSRHRRDDRAKME